MSRITELFKTLRRDGKKAFISFITAGDPDLKFTGDAIERLASAGSSLIEIGFPYSDPIADGPVIQASYSRALDRGIRVVDILQIVKKTSSRVTTPLVAMVSIAIVRRFEVERFIDSAADAGLAGLIVPDLPLEEAGDFAANCKKREIDLIPLITPTTTPERAVQISRLASGFLYYVAVTGITGERSTIPEQLAPRIAWLRQQTDLPICVGFGVSHPEQARALREIADGVIVGSAFVRRIAEAPSPEQALSNLEELARNMVAALAR